MSEQPPTPEDKIIKRGVNYLGKDCPVCENEFLPFINDLNTRTPVEIKDLGSDTDISKKIIEEKKLADQDGNIKMPYIQKCDYYESGKEDCKDLEGFSPTDFQDWEPKPKPEEKKPEETV